MSLLLSLANYAEALVRPTENTDTLSAAVDAIAAIDAMGIALVAPTARISREAARLRAGNISLADGFALATARANQAHLATFDRRVRRSLGPAGVTLLPGLG